MHIYILHESFVFLSLLLLGEGVGWGAYIIYNMYIYTYIYIYVYHIYTYVYIYTHGLPIGSLVILGEKWCPDLALAARDAFPPGGMAA